MITIPIDDALVLRAPYVWKLTGAGAAARAEATMPGAYVRCTCDGATAVGLVVDGSMQRDCPPESMPWIEYSVDYRPFQACQLTRGDVQVVPLADGLNAELPHRVEVYFRATDLRQRWQSSLTHLRLAGFALDGGGLLPTAARPRLAIGFGDSITEGVGVDGLFTSWQCLGVNNARAAWLPLVCRALDCEYGQLGSGGQGMARPMELPPLPQTWDRYDADTSRLTDGKLLPEPDYLFCCMGTNDFALDISPAYAAWLADVRRACPRAMLFCITPPLGWHAAEVQAAVRARHAAGDRRVHGIDIAALAPGFDSAPHAATQLAADGVHPTVYGNALLSTLIVCEVQRILSGRER